MSDTTWPAEWIRATLSQSALAIIAAEDTTYGYRILQRLGGAGFGKIKGGTLYPILARLEADGLVTASWGEGDGGPGRKFISITDAGRDDVARRIDQWRRFAVMIDDLWQGETPQRDLSRPE
jgi:PadR family transcriptional regulator, regulatory protein PadR